MVCRNCWWVSQNISNSPTATAPTNPWCTLPRTRSTGLVWVAGPVLWTSIPIRNKRPAKEARGSANPLRLKSQY